MNWIEQVTVLDLLVKGFVTGIVVSAPLGPVGVLCIQRTLNKGRWYGFVTGLGASLSDFIYALLTGYGMSFIVDFIAANQKYLQLLGSVMLLAFGVYTFRSNPVKSLRPVSHNKGTYLHNFVTAFSSRFPIRLSSSCSSAFLPVSLSCCQKAILQSRWRDTSASCWGHSAGGSALLMLLTKCVIVLMCVAFG